MASTSVVDRFWVKVDKSGDCWIWMAARDPRGYGRFGVRKGLVAMAHRVAYELAVGPIAEGLVIDHLCRNPSCVNPAHLEAVTQGENVRRGAAALPHAPATHCKRGGHLYTPETTHVDPKSGKRICMICKRRNENAWRRARRAA